MHHSLLVSHLSACGPGVAVRPVQHKSEPEKGSLQALLLDAEDTSPRPAQIARLLLLAELSAACEGTGDASPKLADAAVADAASVNAQAVEGLLSALRSAEQLPALLLGWLKGSVRQLQQANAPAGAGAEAGAELPEALPGEALGCGELLKNNKLRQTKPW